MLDDIFYIKLEIEDHQKWLKNKEDGRCANLRNADLKDKFCDIGSPPDASGLLTGKNLAHADLSGADMDSDYEGQYVTSLENTNLESANFRIKRHESFTRKLDRRRYAFV